MTCHYFMFKDLEKIKLNELGRQKSVVLKAKVGQELSGVHELINFSISFSLLCV